MVKFTEYVNASSIWPTAKNHEDRGEKMGLLRGYNVEVRKDGQVDWLSAEWIYGDPNVVFNDEFHTWRTAEHGFEYTGRICFRGYGIEEYDSEERDFYIVEIEDEEISDGESEEYFEEPDDIDDDMVRSLYGMLYIRCVRETEKWNTANLLLIG